MKRKFHKNWEPTLLSEEVLASGTWYYDDEIPYEAKLLKLQYDYSSYDLVELEEILHPYQLDYLDFNISDEGVLYLWRFQGQGRSSQSSTFGSYFAARDHINTYGSKYDISWQTRN